LASGFAFIVLVPAPRHARFHGIAHVLDVLSVDADFARFGGIGRRNLVATVIERGRFGRVAAAARDKSQSWRH
jgi:hypothetical protein